MLAVDRMGCCRGATMTVQLLSWLIGILAAGALLVLWGWRGKRLNDHPVCGWCGFDLEGVYPAAPTAEIQSVMLRGGPPCFAL